MIPNHLLFFFCLSGSSDFRFAAHCNQAPSCWTYFNEHMICKKKLGEDATPCVNMQKNMLSKCPSEWLAKFQEQSTNSTEWLGYNEERIPKWDHSPFGPRTDAAMAAKHAH